LFDENETSSEEDNIIDPGDDDSSDSSEEEDDAEDKSSESTEEEEDELDKHGTARSTAIGQGDGRVGRDGEQGGHPMSFQEIQIKMLDKRRQGNRGGTKVAHPRPHPHPRP
jgi:hypothetical protein